MATHRTPVKACGDGPGSGGGRTPRFTLVTSDAWATVERYCALPGHRTGTAGDRATADWLTEELTARGLHVEAHPFTFPRYETSSTLVCAGRAVEHELASHQWTGRIDTDRLHIALLDDAIGTSPSHFDTHRVDAIRFGAEALVVAHDSPVGALVQVNHDPEHGEGFPVVIVARGDAEALRAHGGHLRADATTVPAEAINLLATDGDDPHPVLLTTPLSGWYSCAGERATGVAAILALVDRLRDRVPLAVLLTSGHELENLGARIAEATLPIRPRAIVHLGASVAATDVDGALAARRFALLRGVAGGEADARRIDELFAVSRHQVSHDPPQWIGESLVWQGRGTPLLSLSGIGPYFHTVLDTPGRGTTPEALTTVLQVLEEAVPRFLGVA